MSVRFSLALLAALVVLLAAGPAGAQATDTPARLTSEVDRILDARAFDDAYWGAYIVNLDSGEVLYDRNGVRRFIPASNMKLLSTAAALDALGPSFRYQTRLYADGDIQDGTLQGNLVVRGAGDPTLGGRYADDDPLRTFRQWADSLRALGVRRITGDVIGDDDIFDNVHLGQGWQWDDLVWYYGAEISGLQFDEGTIHMRSRGTTPGQPARVTVEPDYGYIQVVNRTTTTDGGRIREGYDRALSGNVFTLTSEVPAGETETEDVAVVNPTAYFVSTLVGVLEEAGIDVDGAPVDVDDWGRSPPYEALRRVATHESPRLAEIIKQTNEDSNNVYAEHLLRTLGAYVYQGSEHPLGSAAAGVAAQAPFLERIGVDPESFRVSDGSGLSALNRLTPAGIVGILRGMHQHPSRPTRDAFYASLAVGGYTGTIRRRYRSGDARGNVRAKTGFITGARTLSGYVRSAAGDLIAFSLMCNNYTVPTSRVNRSQDEIVELLADYEGR
ncbi:MAG: D-alanyl-D-alanine carboxypeptidase/D-alanyl-D-alanine-endopeptidase [Bacteroidota bacterium]